MRPRAASLLGSTSGSPPPHDPVGQNWQCLQTPGTSFPCPHAAGFELLFSDAFDGTSLNTTAWVKEAGDGSAVRLACVPWPQNASPWVAAHSWAALRARARPALSARTPC